MYQMFTIISSANEVMRYPAFICLFVCLSVATSRTKKLSYCRDSAHLRSSRLSRSLILIAIESPYATSY